jgi:hypothetical protein
VIAKREADPEAYGIHVPANLEVRAIRTKLKMSLHFPAANEMVVGSWPRSRRPSAA